MLHFYQIYITIRLKCDVELIKENLSFFTQ